MLRLYNTALLPLRAVSSLWAAMPGKDDEREREWSERRARTLPEIEAGGVWIHGASVGEARLVGLLAESLRSRRSDLPIGVSATTRTGRSQLPSPPAVDAAFFAPLDFPGFPDRILAAMQPAVLALIETELWPNLIHETKRRGAAVVVVNGRLSPERMPRYRRLKRLYGPLLGSVDRIGAQSAEEADRFSEIGARRSVIEITGNIKYDLPAPTASAEQLRRRFGLTARRPVVVAGSTGAGEDGPVLDAFLETRGQHPELFLVLAPRHPERIEDVDREATSRGLRLHRLSENDESRAGDSDGLLVDVVGELASLYTLAAVAFVGGSLVPIGGHNVLEPAAVGAPVLFGPHTHHVSGPAESLVAAGGALRVRDAAELAERWMRLLGEPSTRDEMARRAAGVIDASRGALAKSVDLVLSTIATT